MARKRHAERARRAVADTVRYLTDAVPGAAPGTSFGSTARAQIAANGGFPDAYAGFVQQTMAEMQQHAASGEVTTAQDVAEAVFRAATDPDCPLILPAGADAIAWSRDR